MSEKQASIRDGGGPQSSQVDNNGLNQDCVCLTLDRSALSDALARETGDPSFSASLAGSHPHLFADVAVFISDVHFAQMQSIIEAIEAVARNARYRDRVFDWAHESARRDFGPRGVFMGYDFHVGAEGPALIEINTNAGGAALNAVLGRAQLSCCGAAARIASIDDFSSAVLEMFLREWRHQRATGALKVIAIVDDGPQEQYLYPEFVLIQKILERHGLQVIIADPAELECRDGALRTASGARIDLVYNRLVDFALDAPGHAALRRAYLEGLVVLTPNPHLHALLADKRNLTLLSDPALLLGWGVGRSAVESLRQGVPITELVTAAKADRLWTERRHLFFKPARGYGSRAAYRGDKLTKAVWAQILTSDYVAQAYVAPAARSISLDGVRQMRKIDVRLYTYEGRTMMTAARLYQGQTTNMRTTGGGFAPVLRAPSGCLPSICRDDQQSE
ncbi:hypothetical protein [Sphingomonas sp. SRS2]|uniref:hypothetical protein n=1 Tax=Sphingomonas sp. SRS2 TaxID=133190 RepID=UPI000A9C780E|nr:hypothetical protein [Sphingomonas sp. SRS2]